TCPSAPPPPEIDPLSLHDALPISAASRRSLGRVSVPVWPITLSGRLRIVALVGFYPTNKLMRRGPICKRQPEPSFSFFSCEKKHHPVLAPVSRGYPDLTG